MNQTTWYSLFCLFGIWQNISNIKATVNRFVFIPAAESRAKFGVSNIFKISREISCNLV